MIKEGRVGAAIRKGKELLPFVSNEEIKVKISKLLSLTEDVYQKVGELQEPYDKDLEEALKLIEEVYNIYLAN